jgi:N-acylneuraminate cytidylyltransferase
MGIGMVKAQGVEVIVISRESDPVVAARCRKLGIECHQGILGKESILEQLVTDRGLHWSQVIYVGNDSNDLGCMRLAGFSAAPADSHPSALAAADLVLTQNGGHGAVRELCDLILQNNFQNTEK